MFLLTHSPLNRTLESHAYSSRRWRESEFGTHHIPRPKVGENGGAMNIYEDPGEMAENGRNRYGNVSNVSKEKCCHLIWARYHLLIIQGIVNQDLNFVDGQVKNMNSCIIKRVIVC